MNQADALPELPPPSPQPQERTKPVPPHIADVLLLLHILLAYGRHLALTLEVRRSAGRFAVIGQFFGTARLPILRARIARGLLRIQALQRVLLDRARRGRDLTKLKRRQPAPRQQPAPQQQAGQQPATQPTQPAAAAETAQATARLRKLLPRPDPDAPPDPNNLPTLKQLEAEVRRRGIGRSIADICRDLGVHFMLCDRKFFVALCNVLTWYRGDIASLEKDFRKRVKKFEPEWDRDYSLGLPDRAEPDVRAVLGFMIGERWPLLPNPLPPALFIRGLTPPRPS